MGVIDGYPKYPVNDLRARRHVARGSPSALLTLTSPRRGCHQIFWIEKVWIFVDCVYRQKPGQNI